jgi:prepilin-type N-terminal cleavage/methylation domain-containing protein
MKNQKGFTLVELMVVMAIIAILATAGITQYTGFIKNARDTTRTLDLKGIETVVVGEMSSTGQAPEPMDINEKLKEKAGKTFQDPSNGTKSCLDSDGVAADCQYEYGTCDEGGGYVIRARFEDKSKILKYEAGADEYTQEGEAHE